MSRSWAILVVLGLVACSSQDSIPPPQIEGFQNPSSATVETRQTPKTLLSSEGSGRRELVKTFYSFQGGDNGENPQADLLNVNGTIYGTTSGATVLNQSCMACGTIFKVTPSGNLVVLHNFAGATEGDGTLPYGPLTYSNGAIYGTTIYGGTGNNCANAQDGCGTIFEISSSGQYSVVYSFGDPGVSDPGQNPWGGVIMVSGMLYGTTAGGGNYGLGTVFSLAPSGQHTVLHDFGARGDGVYPYSALTNLNGVLYGVTQQGGRGGQGTIFSVTTAGVEKMIYQFKKKVGCASPWAAMVAVGDTLYGATTGGGTNGTGCVFTITPKKNSVKETTLYSFNAKGTGDGETPMSDLAYVNGTFYGTTMSGGASGNGTLYSLKPSGSERVRSSFSDNPIGGVAAIGNTLYGTTLGGGTAGLGTIYSLSL